MKKIFLPLLLIPTIAHSYDSCVLQDRTVTKTTVTIQERSQIRRDVVPDPAGGRKCLVDFRVRINNQWYTAIGEHTWPGDLPSSQACAVAVKNAEDQVKDRVGKITSVNERVLVCKDRPELSTLRNSDIGTVGDSGQFRIHPDYPGRFWHNGAQCRWFVEPNFTGQDIRTFQGVVCEVGKGQWVVIDKF